MIEGIGLKKSFDGRVIFENVSFTIPDGNITGLYGASGIGKSTLAKLLTGILAPDDGEIRLDGEILVSKGKAYDRKKGLVIQQVFQQPHAALDPTQKLLTGFTELMRYHRFAGNKAEEKEILQRILTSVGLEYRILNHLPHQISGGEAQRICIARCLLFRPRLLILDEATSMLDVSTQAGVMNLVRRVMTENGGSVLLISHDRPLVGHMSDKVYYFKDNILTEETR